MSIVEPYSADAAKRRKRRFNDDLFIYGTSPTADKLVMEALSLKDSFMDCDSNKYNLIKNKLYQAYRIYERVGSTDKILTVRCIINDLERVMTDRKAQEMRLLTDLV